MRLGKSASGNQQHSHGGNGAIITVWIDENAIDGPTGKK